MKYPEIDNEEDAQIEFEKQLDRIEILERRSDARLRDLRAVPEEDRNREYYELKDDVLDTAAEIHSLKTDIENYLSQLKEGQR